MRIKLYSVNKITIGGTNIVLREGKRGRTPWLEIVLVTYPDEKDMAGLGNFQQSWESSVWVGMWTVQGNADVAMIFRNEIWTAGISSSDLPLSFLSFSQITQDFTHPLGPYYIKAQIE